MGKISLRKRLGKKNIKMKISLLFSTYKGWVRLRLLGHTNTRPPSLSWGSSQANKQNKSKLVFKTPFSRPPACLQNLFSDIVFMSKLGNDRYKALLLSVRLSAIPSVWITLHLGSVNKIISFCTSCTKLQCFIFFACQSVNQNHLSTLVVFVRISFISTCSNTVTS